MSLRNNNDESLMERVITRDHQAFSILVDRHSSRYYGAAYKIVMNKADAEDIVQAAFLKIWERPQIWQSHKGAKFQTWFYKIVINQCFDFKRKLKKMMPLIGEEFIPSNDQNAEAVIAQTQESDLKNTALNDAIARLPKNQKIAIALCYEEGLKQKDAAQVMDISIKAFESLLGRAKASIKTNLKKGSTT